MLRYMFGKGALSAKILTALLKRLLSRVPSHETNALKALSQVLDVRDNMDQQRFEYAYNCPDQECQNLFQLIRNIEQHQNPDHKLLYKCLRHIYHHINQEGPISPAQHQQVVFLNSHASTAWWASAADELSREVNYLHQVRLGTQTNRSYRYGAHAQSHVLSALSSLRTRSLTRGAVWTAGEGLQRRSLQQP